MNLERDVRDLVLAFRLLCTVVILVFTATAMHGLLGIQGYEKLFEDLLGSKDKLPLLTQWVLHWGRMFPLPVVLVTGAGVLGVMMSWAGRVLWAAIGGLGMASFLVIHSTVVSIALNHPFQQLIQGLAGM